MALRNCILVTGLLAALAIGSAPARANLLINGDFSADPPGTTMAQGVTGWTYSDPTNSGDPSLSYLIDDAYSIAGNYLWLNDFPGPRPTAYQDVAITPGTSYRLTGDYLNRNHNDMSVFGMAIQFIDASGAPTVLETVELPITPVGADPSNWRSFDLTRTFSTSVLRIAFASQYQGDNDTAIDNLQLTGPAAVPEPSTLLLGGLGAAGLLITWRRGGARSSRRP